MRFRTQQRCPERAGAWLQIVTVVFLLVWPEALSAQCAMCRTALSQSAEGQMLVKGINQGILFLLSVPFVLTAIITFKITRAARRNRQETDGDSWKGDPRTSPPV